MIKTGVYLNSEYQIVTLTLLELEKEVLNYLFIFQ